MNAKMIQCQNSSLFPITLCHSSFGIHLNFGRNVPRKPRAVRGVKGHNIKNTTLPGSPGLWPGSFTFDIYP
jgi:hypothetical protein